MPRSKGVVIVCILILTLLSVSVISVYAISDVKQDNKASQSEGAEKGTYTNAEEFQKKLNSLSSTQVSEKAVEREIKTTETQTETTTTNMTTTTTEFKAQETESCEEIYEETEEVRNELQTQLQIVTTTFATTVVTTTTEVKTSSQETITETESSQLTLEDVKSKYRNTISFNMDVTVLSGFTLEEFKILMEGISLDDENDFYTVNAETIYNLCNEYQINEIFFCGIISAESWWGTADNCVAKNNFTGMMGSGGLKYYESPYENLEATARNLHNNYLSPGGSCNNGTTISGVSICYCGPQWPPLVWERMSQIF